MLPVVWTECVCLLRRRLQQIQHFGAYDQALQIVVMMSHDNIPIAGDGLAMIDS